MAVERTLSIIKPDVVEKNIIREIYSQFKLPIFFPEMNNYFQ